MTHEIWNDILLRLKNLRGDMVGQWQGDLDNAQVEQSVMFLGNLISMWKQAEPRTIQASVPSVVDVQQPT